MLQNQKVEDLDPLQEIDRRGLGVTPVLMQQLRVTDPTVLPKMTASHN